MSPLTSWYGAPRLLFSSLAASALAALALAASALASALCLTVPHCASLRLIASALASAFSLRMVLNTEILASPVSGTFAFSRAMLHSMPLSRSRAAFTWLGLATRTILLSTWRREARTEAV